MGKSKTKKKSALTSSPAVDPDGAPKITRSTDGDRETGEFSEKHCITCNIGKRSFSLELTQGGLKNRVLWIEIKIEEKVEGKGFLKLTIAALLNQANGASYVLRNESSGAIRMTREKIWCTQVADAELVGYMFAKQENLVGILSLEKKTNNLKFVEMITAKHFLCIDDVTIYVVTIRIIASNGDAGLRVEVDGPVKRTDDQLAEDFFLVYGKMKDLVEHVVENEQKKQLRISSGILSRILGRK